ncbi:unnamed protein product [Adineta ricciae]|uniref:Pterin-binding domain-containing protein n=1 Tax=Adineta ricciae TaxID=249248 RepID=A0A814TTR1_ADIRI|nr:unnamed protein product [Adineta ricciae]CAF1305702.1 unnamed protein product [Adineta ricciae]
MSNDTVFINNLSTSAIIGKDAWNQASLQPIFISARLNTDFQQASIADDLKHSLNYAVLSRNILELMKINEHKNFQSLHNVAESVSRIMLDPKQGGGEQVEVIVKSTKSEIRADSVEYKLNRTRGAAVSQILDDININSLKILTVIGVFTYEKVQKQYVHIDLSLKVPSKVSISIHQMIDDVVQYVESSNFNTVEALVMKIGQLIIEKHAIDSVGVKVIKPNAIPFTDGVGVSSYMTKDSFKGLQSTQSNFPTSDENSTKNGDHTAYIAFGSNQGNQIKNIREALNYLEEAKIKIISTSSLYISKPMYYKDQPDFFNGVIQVSFKDLSPIDLMTICKEIEYERINRMKKINNGPRSIDLDILLYDDITFNRDDLIIPHKSMLERSFVLQPLCELISPDVLHPVTAEPFHQHLAQMLNSQPDETLQDSLDLLQIIPIPRLELNHEKNPLKFDQLKYKHLTLIMGIMNITPDSFSDGGDNYNMSADVIESTALRLLDEGATILDIGGVSTRPGSIPPSEDEELRRVLPVIKIIRESKNEKLSTCLISVDTYRANVAEECLKAGADIINDISMGLYEPEIFHVIAKYGCPYIMNHTRGTTQTMSSLNNYESNSNEDIVEYMIDPLNPSFNVKNWDSQVTNLINGVSRELGLQIFKAFKSGVRKWQVIIDPGVGFAKNLSQNLIVIKHASYFKRYSMTVNGHSYLTFNGLATLLGPSRKKFLGTLCNEPIARERVISTGATIMACIQQNTDIVRVHDVKEVNKVVKLGDALYKDIYERKE